MHTGIGWGGAGGGVGGAGGGTRPRAGRRSGRAVDVILLLLLLHLVVHGVEVGPPTLLAEVVEGRHPLTALEAEIAEERQLDAAEADLAARNANWWQPDFAF